jgi:hypothetical protein
MGVGQGGSGPSSREASTRGSLSDWLDGRSQGVGSGDLRQMSEYPIPHRRHYHFYILRRWRPALLHPKGEIQV